MVRLLLACGALSSLLYLAAIDVIAPALHPEYHEYRAQMVSELRAAGAPTRILMARVDLAYNGLVLAFALGAWKASRGHRALRFTALAFLGYGLASTVGGLANMDLRSEGLSIRTWLHIAATAVQGLFQIAVLVAGAFVFELRFRIYTFATLAGAALLGAWAGVQASQDVAPYLGLTERGSIYLYMLWIAVLSIGLVRAMPRQPRT